MNALTTREQTIPSMEVAEMVEKTHKNLLADIRHYIRQGNELKIQLVDFFRESAYQDAKGETRPCYQITKKGCEFIAHKLTGAKGTAFTAKYINRFHEMEQELAGGIPASNWLAGETSADRLRCAEIIASCPESRLPYVLAILSGTGIAPAESPHVQPENANTELQERGNSVCDWPSRDGCKIPFDYKTLARLYSERYSTYAQLARAIGCNGKNASHTVSAWCNGKVAPGTEYRNRLCDVFGLSQGSFDLSKTKA